VWLRLALGRKYAPFAPELTPKTAEIIENPTRGKSISDFEQGLTSVFSECYRVLKEDGILAFTFHHAEGSAWEAVLESLQEAGFYIRAAYPVHADAFHSDTIGALGISYDLIHVCMKRATDVGIAKRSWAGIRQEIRRHAREEIRAIEAGRYGKELLVPADVNIILIGKCLELYSRHYGAVVDHEDKPVPLHDALIEIRNMVDQLVEKERPLPSELEDIDAESRVYLLTLAAQKEIKRDDVHKATRGILEPEDLMHAGLMIKGRAGRGYTFEVKQPIERLPALLEIFQPQEAAAVQPSLETNSCPGQAQNAKPCSLTRFTCCLSWLKAAKI
jgi:putative DNA methylase